MDTRLRTTTIVSHEILYGINTPQSEAIRLIEGIPSAALLNYISFFNAVLYLNDHPEDYSDQLNLIHTMIVSLDANKKKRIVEVFEEYKANGQTPVIVWNYSNLLFYDLIFLNFNSEKARELTDREKENVFNAYLLINNITDERFKIPEQEIMQLKSGEGLEFFTVSRFAYQRDYFSSTEIQNQVVRGCYMFPYLESRDDMGPAMQEYYESLGVTGYLDMFVTLQMIFLHAFKKEEDISHRNLIDLADAREIISLSFLNRLSINSSISDYEADLNFSILRNRFLYKVSDYKYLVLDLNFLVNWYYKTHVFALSRFMEEKGVTKEFLSVKAKDFMEDIYFQMIMKRCFPKSLLHFGDTAIIPGKKELCDAYLRDNRKVALIELKDISINAAVKESNDVKKMLKAIEQKFIVNESDKAKGITQLINGLRFLAENPLPFDKSLPDEPLELFPVIIYTDHSFSTDGLNKILNNIFENKWKNYPANRLVVHPLTTINLHFFEIYEEYFSGGLIDLFDLIERFHKHIQQTDFHLTNFDVFAKMYIDKNIAGPVTSPEIYNECSKKILRSRMAFFDAIEKEMKEKKL
jgi:hypothetical protein